MLKLIQLAGGALWIIPFHFIMLLNTFMIYLFLSALYPLELLNSVGHIHTFVLTLIFFLSLCSCRWVVNRLLYRYS